MRKVLVELLPGHRLYGTGGHPRDIVFGGLHQIPTLLFQNAHRRTHEQLRGLLRSIRRPITQGPYRNADHTVNLPVQRLLVGKQSDRIDRFDALLLQHPEQFFLGLGDGSLSGEHRRAVGRDSLHIEHARTIVERQLYLDRLYRLVRLLSESPGANKARNE